MSTVTVSPKFQVVIPRELREALSLKLGQKVHVFCHESRIEIIPVKRIEKLRGFLRGIDTSVLWDDDRG